MAGDCPLIDVIEVSPRAAARLTRPANGGVPIWDARPSLWNARRNRRFSINCGLK
jgi:hypothetical protein